MNAHRRLCFGALNDILSLGKTRFIVCHVTVIAGRPLAGGEETQPVT